MSSRSQGPLSLSWSGSHRLWVSGSSDSVLNPHLNQQTNTKPSVIAALSSTIAHQALVLSNIHRGFGRYTCIGHTILDVITGIFSVIFFEKVNIANSILIFFMEGINEWWGLIVTLF